MLRSMLSKQQAGQREDLATKKTGKRDSTWWMERAKAVGFLGSFVPAEMLQGHIKKGQAMKRFREAERHRLVGKEGKSGRRHIPETDAERGVRGLLAHCHPVIFIGRRRGGPGGARHFHDSCSLQGPCQIPSGWTQMLSWRKAHGPSYLRPDLT